MDRDDFEQWYLMRRAAVCASVAAASSFDPLAADATDEAFARALERWHRVRLMESPDGWTIRVALNEIARRRRRTARETLAAGPAEHVTESQTPMPEVWAAISALPERQRLAVVLRYVGDLTQDGIAHVMGIRPGTVAATLSKARATLAVSLATFASTEGDDLS